MNLFIVFGGFGVILDSFLMSSGDVSDAPDLYLLSSLIYNIFSSSSSATTKSVSHKHLLGGAVNKIRVFSDIVPLFDILEECVR